MSVHPSPSTRAACLVALALAGAAAWTWAAPTTHLGTDTDTTTLVWDYTADGVSGPIAFGEPVLLSVDDTVEVTVRSEGTHSSGSRLVVWGEIASTAGWRRALGPTSTTGNDTASIVLDLGAAREVATNVDRRTDTTGTRTVSAVAEFRVGTEVLGHARLTFDLTPSAAVPATPVVSGGPGAAVPTRSGEDRIQFDQPGTSTLVASVWDLGPVTLDRSHARLAVMIALGVTAPIAVAGVAWDARCRRRSPARDAHRRHGHRMVHVTAVASTPATVVDVIGIDELIRIASELGLPVTVQDGDEVVHRVLDGQTMYRFVAHRTSA